MKQYIWWVIPTNHNWHQGLENMIRTFIFNNKMDKTHSRIVLILWETFTCFTISFSCFSSFLYTAIILTFPSWISLDSQRRSLKVIQRNIFNYLRCHLFPKLCMLVFLTPPCLSLAALSSDSKRASLANSFSLWTCMEHILRPNCVLLLSCLHFYTGGHIRDADSNYTNN